MPATAGGLPLHPLLVHAVVVLVPLTALAAIAAAVAPQVRTRYGSLFVGLATVSLISIPLATNAGEALQQRIPSTPAIEKHAEMGDQLLPLMALLWLTLIAAALLHRRAPAKRGLATGTAIVTIAAAIATKWQCYRIGSTSAHDGGDHG